MKKIFNIVSIISAALLVFACAPKESYKPGAPEDPNCMGVFFPAQQLQSAFAPEETFQVDVKVSRAKASGDVIVPAKVYGNEDEYFFVSPIEFLDGQTETTCSIFFSKDMPLGKEYKLTVAIEDPAYASKYNKNASFINVPVVIENYKYLGKAEFSDDGLDYFASFGGAVIGSYEVDLYQNLMNKAEFRLVDPYKVGLERLLPLDIVPEGINPPVKKLNFRIVQPGEVFNKGTKKEFQIKGEDIVYFGDYYPGISDGDDDMICYSPFDNSVYVLAESEAEVEKNRVVNYQDPNADGEVLPAVVKFYPQYFPDNTGVSYWYGEHEAVIRFPGGEFVDYTFGISTAECKDGQSPITFSLGKDVKAVKYLVYPGELTAKEIRQETALIAAGEKAAEDLDINLPRIFVTCEETGLYTIIGVAFDKNGVQQASASTVFGYVKPGDEEDVAIVFDAALETTPARYEKDGYLTMNSLLFYMVGDDVTSVRYKLLETEDFEENPDSVVEAVTSKGTLLSDVKLEIVNQPGGYVDLFTKLSPLTSYTLVAYAFNGYTGKTVVKSFSTEGLPLENVGEGAFVYTTFFANEDGSPYVDPGLELWLDPNTGKDYEIRDWGYYGVPFKFTQEAKDVHVPGNYIGYTHPSYGPVYVSELHDYLLEDVAYYMSVGATYEQAVAQVKEDYELTDEEFDATSTYDPETKTYSFELIYYVSLGFFTFGEEYYVLDDAPEKATAFASGSKLSLESLNGNFKPSARAHKLPAIVAGISAEREIKAANVEVKAGKAENSGSPRKAQPRKLFSK